MPLRPFDRRMAELCRQDAEADALHRRQTLELEIAAKHKRRLKDMLRPSDHRYYRVDWDKA